MGNFDARHGWNEVTSPLDISSSQTLVAANAGHEILVRRIRGNAGGDFRLRSGTTNIGPNFKSGTNIDIPGLQLKTAVGAALTILGAGVVDANITVQWAYNYRPYPRTDQLPLA